MAAIAGWPCSQMISYMVEKRQEIHLHLSPSHTLSLEFNSSKWLDLLLKYVNHYINALNPLVQ